MYNFSSFYLIVLTIFIFFIVIGLFSLKYCVGFQNLCKDNYFFPLSMRHVYYLGRGNDEKVCCRMSKIKTLGEFIIEKQSDFPYAKGELTRLLSSLRLAAK